MAKYTLDVEEHEIVALVDAAIDRAKSAMHGCEWERAREEIARAEDLERYIPDEAADDEA